MSYPQPNSNQPVLLGSDFFRLNTQLLSPGDVYESEVGSKAIALGPDSDIDIVNVGYFDSQVSSFMNQVKVSAGRAFVGRLDARNEQQYAPSNVQGRILFWSDVVFDPRAYQNVDLKSALGTNTDIQLIRPRMDVVQYFSEAPAVLPQRNDRTYYLQSLKPTTTAATDDEGAILLPYYGRRYGRIDATNLTNATVRLTVLGINFCRVGPSFNNMAFQSTSLVSSAMIIGARNTLIITDEPDGMFDYIAISLVGSGGVDFLGAFPLNIRFSDTPGA